MAEVTAQTIQKELNTIQRKIKALAAKHPYHKVEDFGPIGEGVWFAQVSGPETLGDQLEEIIDSSPRAIRVGRSKRYSGSFDWASQTYIKDADTITFKL